MTETECYDCDYAENCEWELIVANNSCISPPCVAKAWHEKSMKTFYDMTVTLRNKLESGGEEVQRATWGDWKSEKPVFKGIDQTDKGWT